MVLEGFDALELAAVTSVLGSAEGRGPNSPHRVRVLSVIPGRRTVSVAGTGLRLVTDGQLSKEEQATYLAVVSPAEVPEVMDPRLTASVSSAMNQGRIVLMGGKHLPSAARAGLLQHRTVVAPAQLAEPIRSADSSTTVKTSDLYGSDRGLYTAVGPGAWFDMCLSIVREHTGVPAANATAKRLLAPPLRPGSLPRSLVPAPVTANSLNQLQGLIEWIDQNLEENITVDLLGQRSYYSRRALTRRFIAATGVHPRAWVRERRLLRVVELLLDAPGLRLDEIATLSGFNSAAVLRHHFKKRFGLSPSHFRRLHLGP